jgi:tRNA nucleotidyltransferase (CCA-adding enzyme)
MRKDQTNFRALLSTAQLLLLSKIESTAQRREQNVYLVGGAVRDWMLGQDALGDLDLAVEGDASNLAMSLAAEHGGDVVLHDKFNTATWTCAGESIDFAMTRAEQYERPGALPLVRPASIGQDLLRRDFSINAMAVRLRDDAVIDPLDGQGDLAKRRLRVLHDASFFDDPTRLLRAARYAARLNLELDAHTDTLAHAAAGQLHTVSGERIKYDLQLIFVDRAPAAALTRLLDWQVFRSLGIPTPDGERLAKRFARIADVFENNDIALELLEMDVQGLLTLGAWGALCYGQGQLATARWLSLIPFDIRTRDALVQSGLLSTLDQRQFQAASSVQSALLETFGGPALVLGYLFDSNTLKRRAMQCEWKDWRWVRPATTGDDLKARGVPPGPAYGRILTALRAAWLDKTVISFEDEQRLLAQLLAKNDVPGA